MPEPSTLARLIGPFGSFACTSRESDCTFRPWVLV